MFDMVNLLTSGGPGSTTELVSITLKRAAFEKWRTGYSSALAIILFVTVFGAANNLRKTSQPGEAAMTIAAHSVVQASPRTKIVRRRLRDALRCNHDPAAALDRGDGVQVA